METKEVLYIKRLMVAAIIFEDFFVSLGYPAFYKNVAVSLNERLLAMSTFISCAGGIIVCRVWNKYSDKLFHIYFPLVLMELFLNIITVIFALVSKNLRVYYILDVLVASLITRQLMCGNVKIKSIVLLGKDRELFDNTSSMVSDASILLGSVVSFIFGNIISLDSSLIILLVSLISGNIFWTIIYFYIKDKLK